MALLAYIANFIPAPKLRVHKEVRITNPRLILFYLILFVIVAFLVAIRYIWWSQHTLQIPMTTASLISAHPQSLIAMVTFDLMGAPLCSDAPPLRLLNDTRCLRMCYFDEVAAECKPLQEVVIQKSPHEVFLVAAFREKNLSHTQNQTTPVLNIDFDQTYLVPSIENFALLLSYHFVQQEIPVWPFDSIPSQGHAKDSTTVVLDARHKPWRVLSPGTEIILELRALPAITENMPQSVAVDFDHLVDHSINTGGMIDITVNCYTTVFDAEAHIAGRLDDLVHECGNHRPICLVQLRWVDSAQSGTSATYQETTLQISRGLRFESSQGGGFRRCPDLNALVTSITSALVLLALPQLIVRSFTLNFLGHISRCYRRGLEEIFSIRDECGFAAMRLLTHSVSFCALAEKAEGSDPGISKAKMREKLGEMIKKRGHILDDQELDHLVNFCFKAALQPPSQSTTVSSELAASILDEGTHSTCLSDEEALDIDTFCVACSSNERMNFDNVITLFDQDRKKSPMEFMFTPRALTRAIHRTRKGGFSNDQGAEQCSETTETILAPWEDEEEGRRSAKLRFGRTRTYEWQSSTFKSRCLEQEVTDLHGREPASQFGGHPSGATRLDDCQASNSRLGA